MIKTLSTIEDVNYQHKIVSVDADKPEQWLNIGHCQKSRNLNNGNTYELCEFKNGKMHNRDLPDSYNIGRYALCKNFKTLAYKGTQYLRGKLHRVLRGVPKAMAVCVNIRTNKG